MKTHSVLRNWCWSMRSFKNDQALIQFWINCWLQSRLTHKHGWRLTDNGWTPVSTENRGSGGAVLCDIPKAVSSLSHHCMRKKHGWWLTVDGYRLNSWTPVPTEDREERAVLCDTWSSELSIIVLQEVESGLKQCALFHFIASLGDGTADTDGWLKMTVQCWWFQTRCSESRAYLKRVKPCPFLWWPVAQTAVSLHGSTALFPCLPDLLANTLYNHLPHQVKRERHYKVCNRTSA